MADWKNATIKEVKSGDTLVLMGGVSGDRAPPELELRLASIQAPKLGKKIGNEATPDEPGAYDAREVLRQYVGKGVQWRVDYVLREKQNGTIMLEGKSLGHLLVEKGLAKVKRGQNEDVSDLEAVEAQAKAAKKGVWGEKLTVRKMVYSDDDGFNPQQFFAANRLEPMPAVIEHVYHAGLVKALILPIKNGPYHSVQVSLTGIKADDFRGKEAAGPMSGRSKFFVEQRALNRQNITVRLEACDAGGKFHGTLYHPKGIISKFLLAEGLAQVKPTGPGFKECEFGQEFRDIQREAQEAKKGRWLHYEPASFDGAKEILGKCVEVSSGDSIVVKCSETGVERKVYLASVKCAQVRRDQHTPFATEAREFLRKRIIGKKVRVTLDYKVDPAANAAAAAARAAEGKASGKGAPAVGMNGYANGAARDPNDTRPVMIFGTVYERAANVGEELLRKGLGNLNRRGNDDERSEQFEALEAAEQGAMEENLGVHSGQSPPPKRYQDLVGPGNAQRAKQLEGSMQRMGQNKPFAKGPVSAAVIEHCFSAGRFKVRLDHESLQIPVVLAGIKVPTGAREAGNGRGAKAADPFCEEAFGLVRELVNHQECEVQVHSCDKGGNALGSVWYKVDGKPKLLAETLVELGLAKTVEFSLKQMPYGSELMQAENRAKKAVLKWWTVPDADTVEEDSAATASFARVELSHVNGADAFFFVQSDDPLLPQVEQGCASSNATAVKDVRRGHVVLAEYDKKFYRAQVTQVLSRDVQLFFIDSGATGKESIAKLRNCPATIGTDKIKPLAFSAQLAGMKLSPEHSNSAGAFLAGYFGRTLKCDVEGYVAGKGCAVLTPANATRTVNEEIVAEGLVRMDPRYRGKLRAQLDKEQQKARRNRINMWQYGDNYEDEGDYY